MTTHGDLVVRGMNRARDRGVRLGRPLSEKEGQIRAMLLGGMTTVYIRETLGVGASVIQRVKRALISEGEMRR